jgi:hypothetical protein
MQRRDPANGVPILSLLCNTALQQEFTFSPKTCAGQDVAQGIVAIFWLVLPLLLPTTSSRLVQGLPPSCRAWQHIVVTSGGHAWVPPLERLAAGERPVPVGHVVLPGGQHHRPPLLSGHTSGRSGGREGPTDLDSDTHSPHPCSSHLGSTMCTRVCTQASHHCWPGAVYLDDLFPGVFTHWVFTTSSGASLWWFDLLNPHSSCCPGSADLFGPDWEAPVPFPGALAAGRRAAFSLNNVIGMGDGQLLQVGERMCMAAVMQATVHNMSCAPLQCALLGSNF